MLALYRRRIPQSEPTAEEVAVTTSEEPGGTATNLSFSHEHPVRSQAEEAEAHACRASDPTWMPTARLSG
jgi:hypothetical protein